MATSSSGRSVARARCSARSSSSADHGGQRAVQLAALLAAGPLASRRGEQRVRGAHTLAVEPDEAAVERILERLAVRDRDHLVDRQLAAQRDREQDAASRPGELVDTHAQQVFDRVRHADLLARGREALLGEHAPDLEREQRVAQRRVDDVAQQRSRHAQPEPLGQQPARGAEAERPDLEPHRVERALEHRAPAGAPREQERDRLAGQPPGGERERLGRLHVEPRDVVDRDDDRAVGGDGAQQVQQPERDRAWLRRLGRTLGAQQRDLQRRALRGRQRSQLALVDAGAQVTQRGERQPRLGAARPRHEHAHPALARVLDAGLPERRLADPRPAGEHECAGRDLGLDEAADRLELGVTADDLGVRARHMTTLSDRAAPLASRRSGIPVGRGDRPAGGSDVPRALQADGLVVLRADQAVEQRHDPGGEADDHAERDDQRDRARGGDDEADGDRGDDGRQREDREQSGALVGWMFGWAVMGKACVTRARRPPRRLSTDSLSRGAGASVTRPRRPSRSPRAPTAPCACCG